MSNDEDEDDDDEGIQSWRESVLEGMLMVETLKLRLAQIETRLALKRKEKLRLREQKRKSEKQELSTLQVPQSPQRTPPKRIYPCLNPMSASLLLLCSPVPALAFPFHFLVILYISSLSVHFPPIFTYWYLASAPCSPQRILLGIDRGKKASEVSLKNPWKAPTATPEKPKTTFADRLAVAARENKRKSTVQEERERKKSKTFSATAIASTLAHQTGSLQSHVSQTTRSQTTQSRTTQSQTTQPPTTQPPTTRPNPSHPPPNTQTPSTSTNQEEWCKYTGFNLRTRRLPQSVLKEEFKGKTTYSISDLYRLVRPPNFDPPEYDTLDFLVTGIVAQKSPVRQVRGSGGNYLVVKITDLKVCAWWECFFSFLAFWFLCLDFLSFVFCFFSSCV